LKVNILIQKLLANNQQGGGGVKLVDARPSDDKDKSKKNCCGK